MLTIFNPAPCEDFFIIIISLFLCYVKEEFLKLSLFHGIYVFIAFVITNNKSNGVGMV